MICNPPNFQLVTNHGSTAHQPWFNNRLLSPSKHTNRRSLSLPKGRDRLELNPDNRIPLAKENAPFEKEFTM